MPTVSTKKILTIDDEKAIVDLIVDILEANNYQVISATQWTEALDALNHEDPDLVLLDLKMPTIHGTSMLEFLRSEGFTVPIIIVSGFVTESVATELQKQGVHGIVRKPFKASYLLEQVKKVLDEAPASPTPQETPQPPDTSAAPAPPEPAPPSRQNALDALYNRPPAPLPEPDENGSAVPSMDALYGDAEGEKSGPMETLKQTEAETRTEVEASILEALQKASDKAPQQQQSSQTPAVPPAPPTDRLDELQKRELAKPDPLPTAPSADSEPERQKSKPPPADKPPHPGDANASGNPILDAPTSTLAPKTDPFAQRASAPPPSRRRPRVGRKNMLFLGGITVVCLLIAGFLAAMQYFASEAPLIIESYEAKAKDLIKEQAKKEVNKRMQEQKLQMQQQTTGK